jgi:hypothetical protein
LGELNETGSDLFLEATPRQVSSRSRAADGQDFGSIATDQRDGDRINVGLPQPHDDAEALPAYLANRLIDLPFHLRPLVPIMLAHLLEHGFAFIVRQGGEMRPTESGGGDARSRSRIDA